MDFIPLTIGKFNYMKIEDSRKKLVRYVNLDNISEILHDQSSQIPAMIIKHGANKIVISFDNKKEHEKIFALFLRQMKKETSSLESLLGNFFWNTVISTASIAIGTFVCIWFFNKNLKPIRVNCKCEYKPVIISPPVVNSINNAFGKLPSVFFNK